MLAETLTRVDDSSRKNVCSDKTMHKCLFSSVRNTEDQLFLRSLFYYPRHPRTFRYSLLLYFILVPNLDSSISTVLPKSPSLISTFRILLKQIDLSSLSAWATVGFERLVSCEIFLPEICIAHSTITVAEKKPITTTSYLI